MIGILNNAITKADSYLFDSLLTCNCQTYILIDCYAGYYGYLSTVPYFRKICARK